MGEIIPFENKRPVWVDVVILACAAGLFVALISLGNWQLRRLSWKLDLIEAIDTRAFGDPVAAPRGEVSRDDDAYQRVTVNGTFRHDLTQRVKALTELGAGDWVLAPLADDDWTVWINRGFVPQGLPPQEWTNPAGPQEVVGLLRITEPGGTLLETNDPAAGRWYSRDVAALSQNAGLSDGAPYFVDAEHQLAEAAWPRGGLTNVSFRNPHLSYALTWYAMAALLLFGVGYAVWDRMRLKVRTAHARKRGSRENQQR